MSYGCVSKPFWEGDVWLIGGGPSARAFDVRRLEGQRVVSVNDAFFKMASAAYPASVRVSNRCWFSLDNDWIRRNHGRMSKTWTWEKYLAVPLETWPDCDGVAGATYLRWSHEHGLSDDPTTICCGCNSGYGALNLAYLKRADRIHLVGYDMNPADDEKFAYWIPLFREALPQLKASGVEVFNHNMNSHVDAFEKVN